MKKIICGAFLLLSLMAKSQVSDELQAEIDHAVNAIKPFTIHQKGLYFFDVKRISLPGGPTLEYAEQGDESGLPIIFLHGISDSWHSFKNILPLLPGNLHAMAISQRGHGNSERPATDYTPADFATDVAAFIREKNLGPVVIAGHSMGGVVAQQFAIQYPELTRALVIMNSDPAIHLNLGMDEFYNEVMQLEGTFISREFMTSFQQGTLAKSMDSSYFNTLVNEGLKVPLPVFKAALSGLMHTDLRKDVRNIYQPTLIVWGDKDAVFNEDGQRMLYRNIPSSSLIIYEGNGHALHWEDPMRFAEDLLYFLESLPTDIKGNKFRMPPYFSYNNS